MFFQKQLKIKIQVIHISGICTFELQKTSILVLKTVGGVNRTIGVHYSAIGGPNMQKKCQKKCLKAASIFINYQKS